MVSSPLAERVAERMKRLGISEEDLEERFIRGSGAGGQKINKTSSCVQILHRPSGITVRCQKERSQSLNRALARRILCERIENKLLGKESEAKREALKIRKQKQRRSRKAKEKMLKDKARQGEKKKLRAKPSID
jgi:protein subunit release factor B